VHDGRAGEPMPDPNDFAGIIVTGSSASLVRLEPWMEDAAAVVVRARDAGRPVLGVCFGHQLVGFAFGGRVVANPRGWEIGTSTVTLHDAGRRDWLFADLPDTLQVNLVHQDMIEPGSTPASVQVLAGNDMTDVQAVAVDEHVRGVQFHPEGTGAIVRGYIDARRPLLTGRDPDALIAAATDSEHGIQVLRNFRRMVEMA
jgi:GMP synthase (glutamine-hydrolysing)